MGAREKVAEFERVTGGVVRDVPTPLSHAERELRTELLVEETAELVCALAGRNDIARQLASELRGTVRRWRQVLRPGEDGVDLAAVAKELADVEVVLHGTAHYCGVNLDAATAEVHRSNMTKIGPEGPIHRADGKVLKGEGYEAPRPDRLLGHEAPRCCVEDYIGRAA